MNTNDLILKVASRIQDSIDGDTVLLLEQTLPTSIRRVTKMLSQTRLSGHERLITDQSVLASGNITTQAGDSYPSFPISAIANAVVIDDKFHKFQLLTTTGSTYHRGHPVQNLSALGLATAHEKLCYFIEYPRVFLGYPTAVADVNSVIISHYTYLSVANFPNELEDYVIDDLIQLLGFEMQKQQIEDAKP
jgi:hypothetical protein